MAEAASDGELTSTSTTTSAEAETGARKTWLSSTLAAFDSPLYRLIWLGSFMGFLAFNMSGTAQSVVAFDLTGSNSAVGTVMFGQGLAMLLLNPVGGTIADRLNKKLLLLVTQSTIGFVILAMAIVLQLEMMSIAVLATGAFITGSMFAFLGPSRASILGQSVPPDRVGNAMALLQVAGNVGRIIAPFIAGALLSWSILGNSGTYFVIAGMFVLVLVVTARLPNTPPKGNDGRSIFADMKLGLSYVSSKPRLFHGIISYYFLTALGFSFFVLAPGFVKQELGRGTAEIGMLLGVTAAGGLLGSVAVASLADSPKASVLLRGAGVAGAVGLIALSLAPSFVAALAAVMLVGSGIAAFQTLNSAIALRLTEPAYFGRVMGLMQLAWGLINLTSLPVGAFADLFGERAVLTGAGVGLLLAIALLAAWDKRIQQREALA